MRKNRINNNWPADRNQGPNRNRQSNPYNYGDANYNTYAAHNDHFVDERRRDSGRYANTPTGYGNRIYSQTYAEVNQVRGNRMVMGSYDHNDLDFSWNEPIQQQSRSWSNGRNRNKHYR